MEHDLADRVSLLDFAAGVTHVAERVGARDRDLEPGFGDELGKLGQDRGAGSLRVAGGLDAGFNSPRILPGDVAV